MKIGFYVRCPLYLEPVDRDYPRCFMIAQVVEYNVIADAYVVKPHDLLNTSGYYLDDKSEFVFPSSAVDRCAGVVGGVVKAPSGFGTIIDVMQPKGEHEPYQYYIQLDSGEYKVYSEQDLLIEYTQMDYSPLKQMLNYEFQNPSWYASRINVSRNVTFMNNAAYGFKSMVGDRVFLLPHQVSTIARCFETRPIRYMLADEVGLGKTIEACTIVKILHHDNRALRVLFLVPMALVNQWKSELKFKFNMARELESGQFQVESLENTESVEETAWDVMVVDETHRLLSVNNAEVYESVIQLSRKIDNVLLLSATPIQDRKEEYHRLLSVLLPEQYLTMSQERFAFLVNKQKAIQRSVNLVLRRMNDFSEYEEDILQRIESISETLEDSYLNEVKKQLRASESRLPLVKTAISYICENYRLERCVIRNRRSAITTKMPDRALEELPYLAGSSDQLYDEAGAIAATMQYLASSDNFDESFAETIAKPLLAAAFSSAWALKAQIKAFHVDDSSLLNAVDRWVRQADQELLKVDELLDEMPYEINGRLLRLMDYIEQETDLIDGDQKIVIFTGFPETLRKMKQVIEKRLAPHDLTVVAFSSGMSKDELETSVYEFQNNEACRVIICDETGGEGRNFQNASMLLHIDLPWTANALEQRIGRLDRLGRDPNMEVKSVVVYSQNTVEEQLFQIWRDGMQLFSHSLSGMEIITGELNELIRDALCDDVYNGLSNALNDIVEEMEDLRDAVEDEQQFDVGATIYRPLNQAVKVMLDLYLEGEGEDFAKSMLSWGAQAGLVRDKYFGDGKLLQFSEEGFSPRAALQSLFAPPDWSGYEGTSIVRRVGKIRGTFDRQLAIEREDLLFFAPFDPVYEAVASNAVGCSRGRCCAVAVKDSFDYAGFVFTYVVQPDIRYLLDNNVSPQVLSQFRLYLPLQPITVFVPVTRASHTVPEQELEKILKQSWRIRAGKHLGKRGHTANRMSPLESFIAANPDEQWSVLVRKANEKSLEKAKKKLHELANFEAAKSEIERIIEGRRAGQLYFEKDAKAFSAVEYQYVAAWHALEKSIPVLDSICFLVVNKHE